MNWFNAMNEALHYIEDHILEDLTPDEIAKIALCSKFHFMKTFVLLTDMSLGDYIRKRRLTLAAKDLITTPQKVLDIALKYGYESPESFCRAFKRFHQLTPSQVRLGQPSLHAVLPLSFQITIKGAIPMDYRIEKRPSFKVTGLYKRVTKLNGQNLTDIPQFWEMSCKSGQLEKLFNQDPNTYGICYNHDPKSDEFDYLIAVEGDHIPDLEDTTTIEIPASTWAIFKCVGPMPQAIQSLWKQIFSEWFPATKYEHAGTADFEYYLDGDPNANDYISEIWIPVIEKK